MDAIRPDVSPAETSGEFCYGHPKTPTRLHCTRCGRPICDRCAIPAAVGQHCPECFAEARRSAPKVRTALQAGAPATLAIIVINVVFYALQQLIPGFTTSLLAYSPAIAQGEWYRLISAMFLHAGIWHIVFNMLALYYLGPAVEQTLGTARFTILYMVSGSFASAVSYLIAPITSPSLGASGAIFGVFAVVMVLAYHRRMNPGANQLLRNLVGLLILNAALFFVVSNIDIWAHIGGFAAGAALGFAYDRDQGARQSTGLDIAATAVLLIVAIVIVIARTGAITGTPPS